MSFYYKVSFLPNEIILIFLIQNYFKLKIVYFLNLIITLIYIDILGSITLINII